MAKRFLDYATWSDFVRQGMHGEWSFRGSRAVLGTQERHLNGLDGPDGAGGAADARGLFQPITCREDRNDFEW